MHSRWWCTFIFILVKFLSHASTFRTSRFPASRSFLFFRTNVINEKSCTCSTLFSCSCCENVTILYTKMQKRLCSNFMYQRNGLNVDISLGSEILKTMTVTNYSPFKLCANIPGSIFSSLCVNVVELNEYSRSIIACVRHEIRSKAQEWQINYSCLGISTFLPMITPMSSASAIIIMTTGAMTTSATTMKPAMSMATSMKPATTAKPAAMNGATTAKPAAMNGASTAKPAAMNGAMKPPPMNGTASMRPPMMNSNQTLVGIEPKSIRKRALEKIKSPSLIVGFSGRNTQNNRRVRIVNGKEIPRLDLKIGTASEINKTLSLEKVELIKSDYMRREEKNFSKIMMDVTAMPMSFPSVTLYDRSKNFPSRIPPLVESALKKENNSKGDTIIFLDNGKNFSNKTESLIFPN